MPLKIEMTPWGAAPLILCDECGEPIADLRDGNCQWLAETEPGVGTVRRYAFFTHKRCYHPFEQARGGAAAWFAEELAEFLPDLAAGLGAAPDGGRRRADAVL